MVKTKRGQILSDKLLIVIVSVLVLLVVLAFVFKSNITQMVNNLPSYVPPEDKTVDLTKVPTDAIGISQRCPVTVGQINWDYVFPRSITLDPKVKEGYVLGGLTNYVRGGSKLEWNSGKSRVELDEVWDENVAYMYGVDARLVVFDKDIIANADAYRAKHPNLPPTESLILLNYAYKAQNDNRLCKSTEQMAEVVRDIKALRGITT